MQTHQLALDAGVALSLVTVVAAAALALRAALRSEARSVWVPAALAAGALCVSHLPVLGDGQVQPLSWRPWLSLAGTVLLLVMVMKLLQTLQRIPVVRSWMNVASSVLVLVSVTLAAFSQPLQRTTGMDAAEAALALATPACGVIAAITHLVGVQVAGALGTRRERLLLAALTAAAAAAAADVLASSGLLGAVSPAGVQDVALAAGLVLLAAAAAAPAERVTRHEELGAANVIGDVVQLTVVGAILGVDHVVTLPTAAVVLALAAMAVELGSIVFAHRLVTSLGVSHTQARTDELTGLGNRRALAAALDGVGDGDALSLTLVDLDRFKEVNDVLGHDAGDELLRLVAQRLLVGAAPDDVVVRQGGDEFALVRPGTTAEGAAAQAAALVGALEAPFTLGEHQVSVAASVGVAAAPEHCEDAEELQRMADSAMYRAKAAGGGVVLYDAAADAVRRADLDLLGDLREAVAADRLDVHFQPQLDAASGELVGVEALVRWRHPTRGMLPPLVFLPMAERAGLMDTITRQVLRRALAVKALIDGGTRTRMSVNISATSLLDPHLVTTVGALLLEHSVPPGELMLEITETQLMLDATVSRRVVAELVELGVGVSIDDYGTGHSSLAYLKDLPATELKMDRSFVAELGDDPRIATIVRSTVDLAHSLGLRLVAEGVEDETTLDHLVTLGVDVTQGFHHSRPVPAVELARWAQRRRSGASAP